MRALGLQELDQVSGGLVKTAAMSSGLGEPGTSGGRVHKNGNYSPDQGMNDPVYSGYMGKITGIGNYGNDDFATWGSNYSGVAVSTSDTVHIGQQTSPDQFTCKLVGPTGLQEALGVFEVLAGSFDVASGLVMTVGSDGLLAWAGVGIAAVGIAGAENGIGRFDMHLDCKPNGPNAVGNNPEFHGQSAGARTEVV